MEFSEVRRGMKVGFGTRVMSGRIRHNIGTVVGLSGYEGTENHFIIEVDHSTDLVRVHHDRLFPIITEIPAAHVVVTGLKEELEAMFCCGSSLCTHE